MCLCSVWLQKSRTEVRDVVQPDTQDAELAESADSDTECTDVLRTDTTAGSVHER